MRLLSRCFCLLCLCFLVSSARATQIIIQDPTEVPITSTPYPVTFTNSCMDDLTSNFAGYSAAGCFAFVNRTSSAWEGITLTLTSGTPSNNAFDCPTVGVNSVFSSASCSYDPTSGSGVLTFTGGEIPNNTTQYFVISESDLDPSSITFTLNPILAATTPEPPGFTLLATGLLCAGVVLWVRRRPHARA